MSDERPTIRPVTLGRLVEVTYACETRSRTTAEIETALDVTHRRARETILETTRIGLLENATPDAETPAYACTDVGSAFLKAIKAEDWERMNDILERWSPHYGAFLNILPEIAPAGLDEVCRTLEEHAAHTPYTYNQTSVEVLGDWADRLGAVQRHAFSGRYYPVEHQSAPPTFGPNLLTVWDELEETTGINLRQRYLSIPELREAICERLRCSRDAFDDALVDLVQANVGKLELSGAPLDTGAKDAQYGIKTLERADTDGLVSTAQSTDRVMAGVEQFDKQYYYLAVHDRDLTFESTTP